MHWQSWMLLASMIVQATAKATSGLGRITQYWSTTSQWYFYRITYFKFYFIFFKFSRNKLESCCNFLGNCFIPECGCPGAFLQPWCDETKQVSIAWCQKSESNCKSCTGTWCTRETTTTVSSGTVILYIIS